MVTNVITPINDTINIWFITILLAISIILMVFFAVNIYFFDVTYRNPSATMTKTTSLIMIIINSIGLFLSLVGVIWSGIEITYSKSKSGNLLITERNHNGDTINTTVASHVAVDSPKSINQPVTHNNYSSVDQGIADAAGTTSNNF